MHKLCFIIVSLFFISIGYAQKATVRGIVTDSLNNPLPQILVVCIEEPKYQTLTNESGYYAIDLPIDKDITLTFYNISYIQVNQKFRLQSNQKQTLDVILSNKMLNTVYVEFEKNRAVEMTPVDAKQIINLPTSSGNLEDIIKTQIGVTSNNELSSGYSVRGGNFDENLVYVNDIEVYRPFLARSGQQEGLSFANPDMVNNMNFSAGGFEAKYGDKMSSVLDITYKKPTHFETTISGSFLVGALHLQGVTKNRFLAWSIGSRYKSNAYLLNSMDTQGEYLPRFYDVQSFLTFLFNEKLSVEFLGNISSNQYIVKPVNRETTFGTIKDAIKVRMYFDGQEQTQYLTYLAAISANYKPTKKVKLKFITSVYNSTEEEKYTVQGQYFIDQLEADLSKNTFGQVAFNRGIGTFINHGRNAITALVLNAEHKGTYQYNMNQQILWGAKIQHEIITDKLGEWKMSDSAGFITPYSPTLIVLSDVIKANNSLTSTRFSSYIQYAYSKEFSDSSLITITSGIRGSVWSFNNQVLISPRVTLSYKPNWKRDMLFRLSSGVYYQMPFYREIRGFDGKLNTNIKSQQSIHYVASLDYNFKWKQRPFKLVTALYFKDMADLIPYEIDNTRIRYFGTNNAKGFTTGVDLRLNGEFISGVDSWLTLGVMSSMEDIYNDRKVTYFNSKGETIIKGYTLDQKAVDSSVVFPGYIPRPTNQLATFGLFFQDFFPSIPRCKMFLNIMFGSGLPFGPPNHLRWNQIFTMPPYRRVDIGFTYQIIDKEHQLSKTNLFSFLKGAFLSLEVFNLLDIDNTVSYNWLRDVTGRQYAVPNYLTSRQLNIKFQIKL